MCGGMIRISRSVLWGISEHVLSKYPEEACGFLVGKIEGGVRFVDRHVPARNSYTGEKSRRYLIDPLEYKAVEDMAEQSGLSIVGVYHSHPNAPAIPSEFDNSNAVPFLSYLIVSAMRGAIAEFSSWVLNEVTGRLERESLEFYE
jgi:proteasome lid subunit RPN8/RPN11